MDDGAHRENGRLKPPQGQGFLPHQLSMKHIMAIMNERDRAIQERNIAFTEKKTALAERDLAILHRDQAIQERNSAMLERENAIAAFQFRKHTYPLPHQHIHQQLHIKEPEPDPEPEPEKPKKAKKAKEPNIETPKSKVAKKKVKKEREDYEVGLNEVAYDESMPVPFCSCTGVYRSCYKWGSGGWQSSCCTTTMSVYPLPQVPNKRHGRIGGRKMSGSAYNKLLSRLAAEGYDLSNPIDLKNRWAKHGTNRYITIK